MSRWLGEPCALLRCYAKENHRDRTGQACQRLGYIWLNSMTMLSRLSRTLWNCPKGGSFMTTSTQATMTAEAASDKEKDDNNNEFSPSPEGSDWTLYSGMLMKYLLGRIRGIWIKLKYFVTLYSEWSMPVLPTWSIQRRHPCILLPISLYDSVWDVTAYLF